MKNVVQRGSVALVVGVMTLMATGMAAFAQTTTTVDPTGGAAENLSSSGTSWISAHGAPLLVAFLVLGIIFTILVKFSRKGAAAVK